MSLQLDTDTLHRLSFQLKQRGGAEDLSAVVNSAIELWLREQAKLNKGCDPASVRGYQWKTLFLPEGTELRSWSYGEHNYARVVGDEIIHQGKPVTPNQFAQSFARSTRNAWEDLQIRRPEDQHFRPACRLRKDLAGREPAAPAAAPDNVVLALLNALQAQLQAPQLQASPPRSPQPPPSPARPRDITPGQGWDLPERRKFRYRLEDVAFD